MPRIIAGGTRDNTYKDFRTALTKAAGNEFVVLLVDSEGPTSEGVGVWSHLKNRDKWSPPEGVTDDNAHLMVQCMEAWFIADRETLAGFFGSGFRSSALPGRPDVENVSKKRLIDALQNATRQCRPKGRYDKGRHSFQLLGQLDPAKVTEASPYAKRLVRTLMSKASEG